MKKIILTILLIIFALLIVTVSACKKSTPTIQTPPQDQVNPEDVGPPTIVPEGKTPEQYVTEYYEAYKAKDFEKCYEMLPAINKAKEDKESFTATRKSMPIDSFKIETKSSTDDAAVVEAEYELSGQGTWVIVWQFKNSKEGWIAEGYQAGMR